MAKRVNITAKLKYSGQEKTLSIPVDIVQIEISTRPGLKPFETNANPAKDDCPNLPFTVENPKAPVITSAISNGFKPWEFLKFGEMSERKQSQVLEPSYGITTAKIKRPSFSANARVELRSPAENPNAFERLQVGFIQTGKMAGKTKYGDLERTFHYATEIAGNNYNPVDWLTMDFPEGSTKSLSE